MEGRVLDSLEFWSDDDEAFGNQIGVAYLKMDRIWDLYVMRIVSFN